MGLNINPDILGANFYEKKESLRKLKEAVATAHQNDV
jgi:hypothetical protein